MKICLNVRFDRSFTLLWLMSSAAELGCTQTLMSVNQFIVAWILQVVLEKKC
jgi:hypothetical protein